MNDQAPSSNWVIGSLVLDWSLVIWSLRLCRGILRQSLFLRQHLTRLIARFAGGLVAEQRGGVGAEQVRGRVNHRL
jgi:hypothetical protein